MNKEEVRIKEAVMTREAITLAQIHQLLTLAGTMAQIARPDRDEEGTWFELTEAQVAAENLFIQCCDRFEKIVNDDTRWNMEFQQQQEQTFVRAQKAAIDLKIRKANYEDAPHVKHSPSLFRTIDGKWMALLGNPDEPGAGITGVGNCPKEALENFDATFEGRAVTIDPTEWANGLAEKHKNEQQKLDGDGTAADSAGESLGQTMGIDSIPTSGSNPGRLQDHTRSEGPDSSGDSEDGAGKID